MKRFIRNIKKSLVKTLTFFNSLVILSVFVIAFALTAGINARFSLNNEKIIMNTYLVNTLDLVDNQLRDMARVSMVAFADETTQDIMKNSRHYTFNQTLESDTYLKRLFNSLITIRNDIKGILIFDNDNLLFKHDAIGSISLKSGFKVENFPQYFKDSKSARLLNGCDVIVGNLPGFLYGGNYDDAFARNYLITVREVKSFRPHEKIGYIMLLTPVSVLDATLRSPLDEQAVYMLLDSNRNIVSETQGKFISRPLAEVDRDLNSKIASGISSGFLHDFFGEKYIVSYETSAYSGFTLIVAKPTAILYSSAYRILCIITAISLVAILTAVILMSYFTKKTVKPITNLSRTMSMVAKGNTRITEPVISQDETSRLTHSFNMMMDTINDLILNEYETTIKLQQSELAQKEMQLLYLRSQINPHFLYNTLDTIRIKAAINGDDTVAEMIMQLVGFFRFGVGNNRFIVKLEHEIQSIRVYLQLMKYRYPYLEDDYQIEEELLQKDIPSFILQPLVENSLMHGLRLVNYKGRVTISVKRCEAARGDFLISISDNGAGMTDDEFEKLEQMLRSGKPLGDAKRDHIGVYNVQERLKMFYPSEYGLHYRREKTGGVTVTIRLNECPKDLN